MPKGKYTSFDTRQLVIYHRENGKRSYSEIAKMLNIKMGTVGTIIRRYRKENRIDFKIQTGRPQILNLRDKQKILRKIQKNPGLTAAQLTSELFRKTGKRVDPQLIRRVLQEYGYKGHVAERKLNVNDLNRKERLNFAIKYVSKEKEWWKDVIFVDECQFKVSSTNGRSLVWQKINEKLKLKNLKSRIKVNVKVWGCISTFGVGELVFIPDIMDRNKYLEILKNNLLKSANNMGIQDSFKLYQDNKPQHYCNSRLVQEYVLYKCPKVLHPPAQSSDLNPIKNLWAKLKRKIYKTSITSKNELEILLKQEWSSITSKYLMKIISNMPKCLRHVIKQKGSSTKY